MNEALKSFIGQFIRVYIDDNLIYNRNERDHKEHLRQVLEVLRTQKLYAK